MLHNEARKLLVEGYEATHNAEAIAKIFHVNKYTVYHLEERKRKTGSVDLQTWRRGRKALLSSTDKARIAECITKNPTINLEELRTQLGLKISISTMSRVVRALGFRVKKVGLSATERERPRCAGKTYQVERVKIGDRTLDTCVSGRKWREHRDDTQVRTSHRESAGAWQRTAECAGK